MALPIMGTDGWRLWQFILFMILLGESEVWQAGFFYRKIQPVIRQFYTMPRCPSARKREVLNKHEGTNDKELRKNGSHILCLFLTAHAKFDYARKADVYKRQGTICIMGALILMVNIRI